jgi:hypothetical protein
MVSCKKSFLSSMVILVLLIFALIGSAGASSEIWSQTYGGAGYDEAYSVIETLDGGYALAGYTESFVSGDDDFWLVKTDEFGNMEWNKTYGSGRGRDRAFSVVETLDGGYALAGFTQQPDSDMHYTDAWFVKTDASGNVEWNKTYGAEFHEIVRSLVATSDGGYALAGYTLSFGAGNFDFWLVKTDRFGVVEWNQTYGGSGYEMAYTLVETSDGGYALAGDVGGTVWMVKTDNFGNMEWNNTYGSGYCNSLVEASDGGYALAGYTYSFGAGEGNFWLVKTDAYGNVEWKQTYAPDSDWTGSLVETFDGGYVILGNTNSSGAGDEDFWLVKADVDGNIEWKKIYGGTGWDHGNSVVETSDGKYVVAGSTTSFGVGSQDLWLVKTDGCVGTSEFVTYEFDFSFGYDLYTVVVSTNSTLGFFDFGVNQNQISFSVTGPTGTTGFCQITIPEDLVEGDFPVYLNGEPLMEGVDYTRVYNGTHTILDITYSHSTHRIEIAGTNVVPEGSSLSFPLLLLVATFVVIIYKKKFFDDQP